MLGKTGNSPGMRLYYGGAADNQIHELAYAFNDTEWTSQFTFLDTNGNAGFVCGTNDAERKARLFLVNNTNDLRLWTNNLSVIGPPDVTKAAYGNWWEG